MPFYRYKNQIINLDDVNHININQENITFYTVAGDENNSWIGNRGYKVLTINIPKDEIEAVVEQILHLQNK